MPSYPLILEAEWEDGRTTIIQKGLSIGELEDVAIPYLPLRKPTDPRRQFIRLLRIRETHSNEAVRLLDALPKS